MNIDNDNNLETTQNNIINISHHAMKEACLYNYREYIYRRGNGSEKETQK